MIANGENTGRNFVNNFTFEYAKQRIAGKKRNETIDEYRLFNNLLSSQPMAFNLFCPLIQMLKEGWIIAMQQMHIGDKWEVYIQSAASRCHPT